MLDLIALLGLFLVWTWPGLGLGAALYAWGPGGKRLGLAIWYGLEVAFVSLIVGWIILGFIIHN